MDTLTVELHTAMLGQNRAIQTAIDSQRSDLQTAMESQRNESRSQTDSIMDAIRALHSGPPSVQPQPPPSIPEPPVVRAGSELRYRLHSEDQISRALRFENPKRGPEASSLPPSQRLDVRSTPKISKQSMAPTIRGLLIQCCH